MVNVVLVTGSTLEFVHRGEVPESNPMPGVIKWGDRIFIYAYQENPHSFIYRETLAVVLQ